MRMPWRFSEAFSVALRCFFSAGDSFLSFFFLLRCLFFFFYFLSSSEEEEECNRETDSSSDKEETVHEEPEPKKKERVRFTNTKLFPINRPRKQDHVRAGEKTDGPEAGSALPSMVTKLKKYDLAEISTLITSLNRTGKISNWEKLKAKQLQEIVALLKETQDLDQFFVAVMKKGGFYS